MWLGIQGLGVLGHRAMPKLHRILTSGLPKSTHTHNLVYSCEHHTTNSTKPFDVFAVFGLSSFFRVWGLE